MSLQSKSNILREKYSSLNIGIIDEDVRIMSEKNFTSEMFTIKSNLLDLQWHQFSLR